MGHPQLSTLTRWFLPLLLLALAGCASDDRLGGEPVAPAWAVIDRAQEAHGSGLLSQRRVAFSFRGDRYTVDRSGGRFVYTRERTDSTGAAVRDVLSNRGLTRTVDGVPITLSESQRQGAETTLNSVIYFALLPYNLTDDAVQPRLIGVDTVRGAPYDLLEVTFAQEGGGRDWEDRFLYWIHTERSTIDFLAYRFHTGEGGTRFREAVNPRMVEGVRFADYINYTADPQLERLEEYPRLLEAGRLEEVSVVRLEGVVVE